MLGGSSLDQPSLGPQQVAQLTQVRRRHIAWANHSQTHQGSEPLRIIAVGLSPRHVLDVMCVADDQRQGRLVLQYRIDRNPVTAGALHRHARDTVLDEPRTQLAQLLSEGAKGAHELLHLAPCLRPQHARNDGVLVHIQATTAFDQVGFHAGLLGRERDAAGKRQTLLFALARCRGAAHRLRPRRSDRDRRHRAARSRSTDRLPRRREAAVGDSCRQRH